MKPVVVDASVLTKLFFEECHSDAAERCVKRAGDLLAPDLIWAEAANVIWKRHGAVPGPLMWEGPAFLPMT